MKYGFLHDILLMALCASAQVHAMNSSFLNSLIAAEERERVREEEQQRVHERKKQEFENYFQNGNPWADQEEVLSDHLSRTRGKYWPIRKLLPLKNAKPLKEKLISEHDIETLYWGYYTWYVQRYIDCVIGKQELLKRLREEKRCTAREDLSRMVQEFESMERDSSIWLAITRMSGVEHYLCLEMHRYSLREQDYNRYHHDTSANRAEFGKHAIQQALLNKWQAQYTGEDRDAYPWNHASPMSMAIIRHQLYKGFEGLEYKKTTEYTGPAICRIKIQGEWPRDVSFNTLMAALDLADERAKEKKAAREVREADLSTELLWNHESKDLA